MGFQVFYMSHVDHHLILLQSSITSSACCFFFFFFFFLLTSPSGDTSTESPSCGWMPTWTSSVFRFCRQLFRHCYA